MTPITPEISGVFLKVKTVLLLTWVSPLYLNHHCLKLTRCKMDSATDTSREISQSYLPRLIKVNNIDTLLGISRIHCSCFLRFSDFANCSFIQNRLHHRQATRIFPNFVAASLETDSMKTVFSGTFLKKQISEKYSKVTDSNLHKN